ncbi:hypothetical protein [Nonomuraea wenchangensis]|uniref:hypothetical protein n=1 Tax=Nonomuraea wenchangensis TaxID=568860 RepID=UPI003322A77C
MATGTSAQQREQARATILPAPTGIVTVAVAVAPGRADAGGGGLGGAEPRGPALGEPDRESEGWGSEFNGQVNRAGVEGSGSHGAALTRYSRQEAISTRGGGCQWIVGLPLPGCWPSLPGWTRSVRGSACSPAWPRMRGQPPRRARGGGQQRVVQAHSETAPLHGR